VREGNEAAIIENDLKAVDHARPSLVRAAIALRASTPGTDPSTDRASKRTESVEEPRRGDPVSAAATRSPSQPGEASFRLGSPYG